MNPNHRSSPALRWLAAGAGLATALYATRATFTWLKYGHPPGPDTDETDSLLDEFMPRVRAAARAIAAGAATSAPQGYSRVSVPSTKPQPNTTAK